MTTASIGNLNYSLRMDSSQLNASATLTRQQLRDVRRVMEETKDPAQRLQENVDRLTSIYEAGAISAEQYQKAVANAHAKSPQGIEAAAKAAEMEAAAKKRLAEAEALQQARLREGEAITRSVRTEQEKYLDTVSDLQRHLNDGSISLETFNRRMDQIDPVRLQEMADAKEAIANADRAAADAAAAFQARQREGEAITKAARSEQEIFADTVSDLQRHLNDGTISLETFNRRIAQIDPDRIQRLRTEEELHNNALRDADRLLQEVETEEEQRIARLSRLNELLHRGYINQETYNRHLSRMGNGSPMAGVRDAAGDLASSLPGVANATRMFAAAGGGTAALALASGLGAVVAVGVGTAHVIGQVREEMQKVDDMGDVAAKLGMSFAELNTLTTSLSISSGLDDGAIQNAMQALTIGMHEAAATGSGKVAETLGALGLKAGDLLAKGPVAAMKDIMAATQGLQNETDQLAVAYELFGKQGAALVGALRDGPDALNATMQELDRTGMNLTESQIAGIGAANDAWESMGWISTGVYRQLAAEFAPVVELIANTIKDGSSGFLQIKGYLPSIVDYGVQFAGWIYDASEILTLSYRTMKNIVTLDFAQIGKDVNSAMDLGTGQRNLEAVYESRHRANVAAMESANKQSQESVFAEIERRKAAEEQIAEHAKAVAKARDEEQKRLQREAETLQRKKQADEEQERKRIAQEEQAERQRAIQAVETFHSKYTDGYSLSKQIAEVDRLRSQGLLNAADHAKFRSKILNDEAEKDVKRATSTTAARGSDQEYELVKAMQNSAIDKQILEMRKHERFLSASNTELANIRRALENNTPKRIR